MKWIRGRGRWLVVLGIGMILGTGMTSLAAVNVRIRIESGAKSSWTEEIKVPVVTVDGSENSPQWSKSVDEWVPGRKVTATIVVPGTYTKSRCSIYGGELASLNSSDGETTIKIYYLPTAMLGTPERAGWSDAEKTKASWKKVPFASKYQLRLYRDGDWVKTLTSGSATIDLKEYMVDGSSYYYEVRAIAKDNAESNYLKDGEFIISDDSVVQNLGDTSGRWSQYQQGKMYRESDGSYATTGWKLISGSWYYFNNSGYATPGWQYINDKWYYFNADAQMLTGWQQSNGKWYYLSDKGDMAIGWVQTEPSKWYYLYGDGSMAADTTIDGLYRVDASGLMVP